MTVTKSVQTIQASDETPIRTYRWSGSAPSRGIVQIAHGMCTEMPAMRLLNEINRSEVVANLRAWIDRVTSRFGPA